MDKTHNLQNASELTAEEAEMLRGLAEAEEKITIADKVFVTDYSNRREIFAFTADGLFYKVTMELFLYKDEIYLTTGFTGDKNTAKDQSLTGVKLPAEQQERFAELFRK